MRIVLNAASANMGGATTYLQNVLKSLSSLAAGDEFIVIVPARTLKTFGNDTFSNVEFREYPFEETGGIRRMYFDQIALPRLLRSLSADVLFSTTGFGTWFSPVPQVLLVRNSAYFDPLFHRRYRELGRSLREITIRRWLSVLSMKRSDVVLFPTDAMRSMVEHQTDLDGKETAAIHYGFDAHAFGQRPEVEPSWLRQIQNYREEGYHILVNVSTYATQKNLETLLEALPYLQQRGLRVRLLTTTSRERTSDIEQYDGLRRRAHELDLAGVWHELGYVPHDDLSVLYGQADVCAFPSFTESFGHPMVEAMASGLPVVAAGTTTNREVCGEAGVFFNTFDPVDCAEKLAEVLTDDRSYARLSASALRRAAEFSWHNYSRRLLQVFRCLHTERMGR